MSKCIDLDIEDGAASSIAQDLYTELLAEDHESEVDLRNSQRFVPRLVPYKPIMSTKVQEATGGYRLKLKEFGVFESLYQEPMEKQVPNGEEVVIEVFATGLNFRDVLRALGMMRDHEKHLGFTSPGTLPFGFECAGVVTSVGSGVRNVAVGDEVFTICFTSGGMNKYVKVPGNVVFPKPKTISFSEAAAVPLAFGTALYGLGHLANLRSGQRVLIHAASGGVGQAAVQWAQHIGAEQARRNGDGLNKWG